jgi:ribonuclease D
MKEQLDRIEAKLDKLIKALQEYDGLDEDYNKPEDEYAWESINSAVDKWADKRTEEVRELLKNSNIEEVLKSQPKPKKKYYKPKNKKK